MWMDLRRWLGTGAHNASSEAEASWPTGPTRLQSRDDVVAAVMDLREQLAVVEASMQGVQQSVTQCEAWLRVYAQDTQALLEETEFVTCTQLDSDANVGPSTQESCATDDEACHSCMPDITVDSLGERYKAIRRNYIETTYNIRRRILQLRVRMHTMTQERTQVKHNLSAVMARYDIAPDEVYVVPPSPIALSFTLVPHTP